MKEVILSFAILSILVNYPHTYWALDYVSQVKEKFTLWESLGGYTISPKSIQTYLFCIILSTAILFLVIMELTLVAGAFCVIEIIINSYYVYCSYEEKYLRHGSDENAQKRKFRSLFGAYSFGILIPVLIYTFSHLYTMVQFKKIYIFTQTKRAYND